MALTDLFSTPEGFTPKQQEWLKGQQMMGLAQGLLAAGAPSTDPRSGSLAYALSQGMGGMAGARGQAMQDVLRMEQMEDWRAKKAREKALRERLGGIATHEMLPMGPPTPEGEWGQTPGERRGLGDYLTEYTTAALEAGDVDTARKAASMMPTQAEPKIMPQTTDIQQDGKWTRYQLNPATGRYDIRVGDVSGKYRDKGKGGVGGKASKDAFAYMKTVLQKPDKYGMVYKLDDETIRSAQMKIDKLIKDNPTASPQTIGEMAIREIETARRAAGEEAKKAGEMAHDSTPSPASDTPPMLGAQKGKDGKWYVNIDGVWNLVE
jgi:hypothetical protein